LFFKFSATLYHGRLQFVYSGVRKNVGGSSFFNSVPCYEGEAGRILRRKRRDTQTRQMSYKIIASHFYFSYAREPIDFDETLRSRTEKKRRNRNIKRTTVVHSIFVCISLGNR